MKKIIVIGKENKPANTNIDDLILCINKADVRYENESWSSIIELIKENDIDIIAGSKDDINIISRLLWESDNLKQYVLTDADEAFCIEETNDRRNKIRWDIVANKAEENNSIEQSGWVSSFTGEPFSEKEMDEFAENVRYKLKNFCSKCTRVLEIGIASGLTCFKIAPLVDKYIGMDLSEITLKKTRQALNDYKISNVELVPGGV